MTTLVHYIYVGKQVPQQTTKKRFIWSSPMHRERAGVRTILWCNQDLFKPLGSLVCARESRHRSPIDEIKLIEPLLVGSFPLLEAAKLLFKWECYVALKDMMSLAIVHGMGGYFLDASTYLAEFPPTERNEDKSLQSEVNRLRSTNIITVQPTNHAFRPYVLGPRFPALRSVQSSDQGEQQGKQIHRLGANSPRSGLKLITPWLEYWALYANKGDPTLGKMLDTYVANVRWRNAVVNGWTLEAVLTRGVANGLSEDNARALRNNVIGGLMCSAVKDGLLACWPGLHTASDSEDVRGSAFGAMTWDAFLYRRPGDEGHKRPVDRRWLRAYVPELNLMKRYEGSWR